MSKTTSLMIGAPEVRRLTNCPTTTTCGPLQMVKGLTEWWSHWEPLDSKAVFSLVIHLLIICILNNPYTTM